MSLEDALKEWEAATRKVVGALIEEHERDLAEIEAMSDGELLDEMDRLEAEIHFSDEPPLGAEKRWDQVETAMELRRLYGRPEVR